MKRILYTVAAAIGIVCCLPPLSASAHTPSAVANCQWLQVDLQAYEPGDGHNNLVTVWIDDLPYQAFEFGHRFERTFPWSGWQAHTFTVKVDANRTNGGNTGLYDKTITGTSIPCLPPPTTIPPTTTTTTTLPPTTTVAPTTTTTTLPPSTPAPTSSTTTSTVVLTDPPTIPPTEPPTSPPDTPAPTEPPTLPTAVLPVCADGWGRAEDGSCIPPGYSDTTTVAPAPTLSGTLPQTGMGRASGPAAVGLLLTGCGVALMLTARRRFGRP